MGATCEYVIGNDCGFVSNATGVEKTYLDSLPTHAETPAGKRSGWADPQGGGRYMVSIPVFDAIKRMTGVSDGHGDLVDLVRVIPGYLFNIDGTIADGQLPAEEYPGAGAFPDPNRPDQWEKIANYFYAATPLGDADAQGQFVSDNGVIQYENDSGSAYPANLDDVESTSAGSYGGPQFYVRRSDISAYNAAT